MSWFIWWPAECIFCALYADISISVLIYHLNQKLIISAWPQTIELGNFLVTRLFYCSTVSASIYLPIFFLYTCFIHAF